MACEGAAVSKVGWRGRVRHAVDSIRWRGRCVLAASQDLVFWGVHVIGSMVAARLRWGEAAREHAILVSTVVELIYRL